MNEHLILALRATVGEQYVVIERNDLWVYRHDGSVDHAWPGAVVLPVTTEQVSKVVQLATAANVPVVARGAGTGLSGGAVANGTILLSLNRMRRILDVSAANRTALVEPGVVNIDISKAAHQYGLYYAPDPSSQKACTIGGNVAENAGGPHCLRYGMTNNHVLGMEVVLEDGSAVWLGGSHRDAPGYDLAGAFVGSEGMFGVATKILVRLLKEPEAVRTYLAIFNSMEQASSAVSGIIGGGIVPAALEMMDALAIRAVENTRPMGYPLDAEAVLLVEVDGLREEVDEDGVDVLRICREAGARDVRVAESEEERERLWAGRKGALGALGTIAPNYVLVDGVVPRTRIGEALRRVSEISKEYGLPIANVFHAGDGNLHPCIVFDERKPGETGRALAAGGAILKACVDLGGALSGEHGIGLEKQEYMPLLFNSDDLRTMGWLCAGFAPRGLFNPGKVFPRGAPAKPTNVRPITASKNGDAWI
ncbi:MAG: FAD-binding protein [Dehalococcoidia bacterium]|nr:FAD-binding protein [Dehalococcoidia bacterium]